MRGTKGAHCYQTSSEINFSQLFWTNVKNMKFSNDKNCKIKALSEVFAGALRWAAVGKGSPNSQIANVMAYLDALLALFDCYKNYSEK